MAPTLMDAELSCLGGMTGPLDGTAKSRTD